MLIENETDKLLMIPGPTPVQHEILAALGEPTVAHTSGALANVILHCAAGLRMTAGTDNASTFVFAGAGTLAQEAAVVNLVGAGERLLVVSNGYFGDRFVEIANAHGIECDRLVAPWGQAVTALEVEERLCSGNYKALTITHVDTSTGVAAPAADIAGIARAHGVLSILDSVCALGGMPVEMTRNGYDVVLTGAQKALGVPPGLAILLLSDDALAARRAIPRISSFYADLLRWEASMVDPKLYFSTHAVNHFYALQVGLDLIAQEGLANRFQRHRDLAAAFREGTQILGFTSLTEERSLAPTLSVLAYPDGVDDASFREALARQGVVAAGCLGVFKGKGIRFGHMGNIGQGEIMRALRAIEGALVDLGHAVQSGASTSAAQSHFSVPTTG